MTVLCVDDPAPGQDCAPDDIVDEITERPYLSVGIGVAAGITVVAAVEAYVKAKRARAANEELFGPIADTGEGGFMAGLPAVSTRGGRVDLSFVRFRFR